MHSYCMRCIRCSTIRAESYHTTIHKSSRALNPGCFGRALLNVLFCTQVDISRRYPIDIIQGDNVPDENFQESLERIRIETRNKIHIRAKGFDHAAPERRPETARPEQASPCSTIFLCLFQLVVKSLWPTTHVLLSRQTTDTLLTQLSGLTISILSLPAVTDNITNDPS